MPRTRANKRDICIAKFEALLTEGLTQNRLTRRELTERMGFSQTRMRTIRNNPLKITFEEVGQLSDILGIPEESFHEILRNIPRY